MREIKFRAFAKYDQCWVYGFLSRKWDDFFITNEDGEAWLVDKESVGQFTGLKVKHENEVYEGDICNFGNYTEPPMVVKYINEKSALCLVCVETEEQYLFNEFHYEELVILGNIHEHEGIFF